MSIEGPNLFRNQFSGVKKIGILRETVFGIFIGEFNGCMSRYLTSALLAVDATLPRFIARY